MSHFSPWTQPPLRNISALNILVSGHSNTCKYLNYTYTVYIPEICLCTNAVWFSQFPVILKLQSHTSSGVKPVWGEEVQTDSGGDFSTGSWTEQSSSWKEQNGTAGFKVWDLWGSTETCWVETVGVDSQTDVWMHGVVTGVWGSKVHMLEFLDVDICVFALLTVFVSPCRAWETSQRRLDTSNQIL